MRHNSRNFVQPFSNVRHRGRSYPCEAAMPTPVVAEQIGRPAAPSHGRIAIGRTQAERLKLRADDEKGRSKQLCTCGKTCGINIFMNSHQQLHDDQFGLMLVLKTLLERRFLPIEEGPWIVEGVCVSARTVANAKGQPAATRTVELAFECDDEWSVTVRAALCQGKLWQPERWLRVHDCGGAGDREEAELLARFSEWVKAT